MPPNRAEDQRVLVTGAGGFIGSALLARLTDEGYRVRAASRTAGPGTVACEWRQCDLDDRTRLESLLAGVDTVVHLAGRAHRPARGTDDELAAFRRANTQITERLADAALAAGVRRFLFMSSIGVNGQATADRAFDERGAPNPVTPYALSKLEAEQALAGRMGRGMDIVILRPALVYGTDAPGNIGRLLRWIAAGKPIPFGSRGNARSFIALDNLVDLVVRCIEHPAAADEIFLAADDERLSTTELITLLAEGMGKTPLIVPMPGTLFKLFATSFGKSALYTQLYGSLEIDNGKARSLLAWTPPVDARTALKRIGAEYFSRINHA